MLEKTARPAASLSARRDHAPLTIRRVDAIPVALPLKTPMKMSAETITAAQNLLVRVEAADGSVGWGEAASAPTMTGDTLGGLVAAVRDHSRLMLIGKDARMAECSCGRHYIARCWATAAPIRRLRWRCWI